MLAEVAHPWFHSAVERLDVRRRDRLLAVDADEREAAALRALVGEQGELTLVLRDHAAAERLAERDWRQVRILAHAVDGGETFGAFDSLLVAPPTGPLLDAAGHARLARRNLRPGGRFVVDLPAPDMVPDLRAAWLELGWDEERLGPLSGPSDLELAEALREAGLRNVRAALGSHLLHLPAAADLVDALTAALELGDEERDDLTHAVVRKRKDAGPLDVLVHRTQVAGQR